jgi:hypothetical protein
VYYGTISFTVSKTNTMTPSNEFAFCQSRCSLCRCVFTAYSLNRTVETVHRAVSRVSRGAALYSVTLCTIFFYYPFSPSIHCPIPYSPFTARPTCCPAITAIQCCVHRLVFTDLCSQPFSLSHPLPCTARFTVCTALFTAFSNGAVNTCSIGHRIEVVHGSQI